MTLKEGFEKAKSIRFVSAFHYEKPPHASLIFLKEDAFIFEQLYQQLLKVVPDNPITLYFKAMNDKKILVSFYDKNNGSSFASILVDYNKDEFDLFISNTTQTLPFTLLFGIVENGKIKYSGFAKDYITVSEYEYEK